MESSTDPFDPAINRGTLPKGWHRCSSCRTVTQHHVDGRCSDVAWCTAQTRPAQEPAETFSACTTCGQALPHVVACGATVDPELSGAA